MNLAFVHNFPLFCIILTLFSGPCSMILSAKKARILNLCVITAVGIMSLLVLVEVCMSGGSYVYTMGHFPAPWGNEIRVGPLEAFMALFFCIIMFLSMVGGAAQRKAKLEESKENLYYVMVNLLLSSLLALVYTGICVCGDQHDLCLRNDHDQAEWSYTGGGDALHDHESVGIRSAASGNLLPLRTDGASFDEQYQRGSGGHRGDGHLSRTAHGGGGTHVCRTGDQERAVPLSFLAAGCLRILHRILSCDSVFTCVKGLYFSADQDLLPCDRL